MAPEHPPAGGKCEEKRPTANALAFEERYEENLFALYEDILRREYKIGRSVCFIVDKPVKREIFAADFRDRIVHHLLFNWLNPVFEPHFIKDSYSCRKGKGTSAGVRELGSFIRSCSENHIKECWVLKLDIEGYFMSIDRAILHTKIERKLRALKNPPFDLDTAFYLLRLVAFNNPTTNFVMRGTREDWRGLPKSKSLFFAASGKGFPVGNLTSQLFSNIYLDDFDHFVREELGVRRYGRYVDDMVFIHSDKEAMKALVPKIGGYLRDSLGLKLHPKKLYLQEARKGVSFLGTFLKPWRTYIGRRTKRNLYAKLTEWNILAKESGGLGQEGITSFFASINSYLGMLSHYDTFKLRSKVVARICGQILRDVAFSSDLSKASAKALMALIIFAGIGIATSSLASAQSAYFFSSGTATSTNLLAGRSAVAITSFYYNLSSLPGDSSVTIQFSQNGTSWYSSAGVLGGSDTLSTLSGASVSLSALSWSGASFYYKITMNATSDYTQSPVMRSVRLDYTPATGYGHMLAVDSTTGYMAVGGGGAGASQLSVLGGATFGSNYFTSTTTNGILVEGNVGIGTT
ncbi:MAG: reverse transcriptase/maturase family protein, partial [Candidatus Spechtbacterales bacterium]